MNPRLPAPKAGALPDCAMPRLFIYQRLTETTKPDCFADRGKAATPSYRFSSPRILRQCISHRVRHFFDYADTSLSFGFRSRSFDSVEKAIAVLRSMSRDRITWSHITRKYGARRIGASGHWLEDFELPVRIATRLGLAFVRFCLSVKLGLQWIKSVRTSR